MTEKDYDNYPESAWMRLSDEQVREAMLLMYGVAPSLLEMKRPGEARSMVFRCAACGRELDAKAADRARRRGGCLSCKPDQRKRGAA